MTKHESFTVLEYLQQVGELTGCILLGTI